MMALSRFLLAAASALLALAGLMHAKAFSGAAAAVAGSNLQSFYAVSLKALWLIDSATLLVLAAVLGLIAVRPGLAGRAVILLLALIPAATAAFQYVFIGRFLPAHLFVAAAVMMIIAGLTHGRRG